MKTLRGILLAGAAALAMGAAEVNSNLWQIDTSTTPPTVTVKYGTRTLTLQNGTDAGFIPVMATLGNGIPTALSLKMLRATTAAGVPLAAAAASGTFGYSITLGTSGLFIGEAANSNTKTDNVLMAVALPANYKPGSNLTVKTAVELVGTGVAGTATFQLKAYRIATTGLSGSDIGPGSATAITTGDITSTVTGTTLNPGDLLLLEGTVVLQETGGLADLNATLGPFRIS